ncbi:chorion class B protein M2410-like [Hyposmocoma kahamanoa]|uniref:chorion class B protein M2410-like n=1 Tax=Hyposmocoma kahamanoa TaxID=1477025 RepID=UPI000E6D9C7C|nr:chorion class B protein M2410-like [Hyposmocoma kahamanoa]
MAANRFLVFCASALFVQSVSSQCSGADYNNIGWSGPPHGVGSCGRSSASFTPISLPTSGGGLAVISSSPIVPNGLQVFSENSINGDIAVTGQLPVLAAVAVEGSVPTTGSAATTYSCGNGNVGIISEGGVPYGVGQAGLPGAGFAAGPFLETGAAFVPVSKGEMGIGTGCNDIYW